MMPFRSGLLTSLVLVVTLAALAPAAHGQATVTPPFKTGATKVYCHASADSLTVWMSTLEDDGAFPYYFFGASTTTVPGLGAGIDPVVMQDFTTRIALTPTLAQDLVIAGTVTVQAFIGGGTYTVAEGNIGTSLAVGGTVIGSAAEKDHSMRPSGTGATYTPISWTFDVPSTTVPKGAALEWIISGTITGGNNVYLGCHEARGRSSIELPVASTSAVPATNSTGGNSTVNGNTSGNATGNSTSTTTSGAPSNNSTTTSRTTTSSRSSTTVSGNDTLNGTTDEGTKDSPALALPAVLVATLACAVAIRRRLP